MALRSRSIRFLMVLVLPLLLGLASCSSDDTDSPPTSDDGPSATDDSDDPDGPQVISSMEPASGEVDEFVWNLDSEPPTLDPGNAASYSSGTVVRNLCDSLLTVDADFNLVPNLATYEVKSPTEIVFTIRDDAKFWNGNPVTADDVTYSLKRTMEPKYVSAYFFVNVEDIETTGPDEVTVTFKEPDELFINEMPVSSILEREFSEAAGDALGTASGGLMCSGPFKLDEWKSGSHITMSRNADYWNEDRIPRTEKVKFTFVSDQTALAQALDSGEIDGAYEIAPSSVPSLSASSNGRLAFGPSTQSTNIDITNPDGPLADQNLRDAMQVAIDREGIAEAIFHGAASPKYTSLNPATWDNEALAAYEAAYEPFEESRTFDADAAQALVAESDYDGSSLVLGINADDDLSAQLAQILQAQWKNVGIEVEISSMQPLVYTQAAYDGSKREGLDLMLVTNFDVAHDPLEPLGFIYLPGLPYNYVGYDDPVVTEMITGARQEFDAAKRADMVIRAQSLYEEAGWRIPLVSNHTTTFLNDRLGGAVTSFAYWSMPSLSYVGAR